MSWTVLGDLLFLAGGIAAAGLVAYGGWLCISEVIHGLRSAAIPKQASQAKDVEKSSTQVDGETSEETPAAIAVASLLLPGFLLGLAPSGTALAADPLERGLQAYEETRYAEAVAQFRQAADAGNGRAQEILGFMYLHGHSLYGAAVPSDRAQAAHWFRRAAQGGHEVSQHMLCVLEGRPAQTVVGRTACGRPAAALGAPGPDGMARAAASEAGKR